MKLINMPRAERRVTECMSGIVSIQRDQKNRKKNIIQAQCCKPGPCWPKR